MRNARSPSFATVKPCRLVTVRANVDGALFDGKAFFVVPALAFTRLTHPANFDILLPDVTSDR